MLKKTEKSPLKLCSKQEEQVKPKRIAWGRWNNINMKKNRPTQLFGFSLSLSKTVIFKLECVT